MSVHRFLLPLRRLVVSSSPSNSSACIVHLAGETGTGLVGRYVNDSLPTTFITDPKGIVRAILPRWGKDTEKKLGAELEKLVTAGSKT